MKDCSSWIIQRRWAITITTILLAIASVVALPKLTVNADFFHYMPEDNPVVQDFNRLTKGFSHDSVMIVIENDHLFSSEGLQSVWDISQEITQMKGLASITSLANVASINSTAEGLDITPLLNKEALGRDQAFYDDLKKRVTSDPHYRGMLVSPDGRYTAIVVNLAKEAIPDEASATLRQIVAKHKGNSTVHFAGTPMMMNAIEDLLWGDMMILVPLVVILLIVVLYLSFKRFLGIWLPLAAVGLGTLMVLAIMAYCGVPMTMISAILPIILLSNGSAYGIHVLSAIRQKQAENPDSDNNQTVLASLKKVAIPVSLAALTTLVGFLSFLSSPLSIFKEFGVEAAIGIIFSLVLALVFVPAVASFFPPRKKAATTDNATPDHAKKIHWLDKLMGHWANFVSSHYKTIVIAAVIITLAAIPGIFRLHGSLDIMGFFAPDTTIRQADKVMNDQFGGSQPIFIALNADSVKNPVILQKLNEVVKEVRVNPDIHQLNSIAAIIAELNYHLDGLEMIPTSQEAIGNLWVMVAGNESLSQMVDEDAKSAMVVGRVEQLSTEALKELVGKISSHITKDNVALAMDLTQVKADKLAELQKLMAQEIAHQLALDSRYYLPAQAVNEEAIAKEVLAALATPSANLDEAGRIKLAIEYFNSDDCDILLESESLKEKLAQKAAQVSTIDAFAIEDEWQDAATEINDPDGLSMAATSLADIFERGAKMEKSRQLLATLQEKGLLAKELPALMQREINGELFRIHHGSWIVSPGQYQEYTGTAAAESQLAKFTLEQAGMHLVTIAISDGLTESQIYSLLVSLILVFMALLLQLRSVKGSAIALLPVIFTIIFMFGFEGYLAINIDILTALIASLAVGIGIDYSIHISFAINRAARAGAAYEEQLLQAINGSGQAIIINASAVVAGFLVIVASQMPVLRIFGGLVAMAIGLSALGALTILPSIYLWLHKK